MLTEKMQLKQKELLKNGTGFQCCDFAQKFEHKGADIPALQRKMMDLGMDIYCYCFAKLIASADILALKSRHAELGGRFAADFDALVRARLH